jgi:hypothetical protein
VFGLGASDVFAVGNQGRIVHFGGSMWSLQETLGVDLRSLAPGPVDLLAAGDGLFERAGATWNEVSSPASTGQVSGMWSAPDGSVFLVGDRGIGRWRDQTIEAMAAEPFDAIWGAAADDVFAVGADGRIARYDGVDWTPMVVPISTAFDDVWGTAGDDVFAVGDGGTILHYDGSRWRAVATPVPTDAGLRCVWGHGQSIFIGGDDGTMFRLIRSPGS